jgi:hypothetical protein
MSDSDQVSPKSLAGYSQKSEFVDATNYVLTKNAELQVQKSTLVDHLSRVTEKLIDQKMSTIIIRPPAALAKTLILWLL